MMKMLFTINDQMKKEEEEEFALTNSFESLQKQTDEEFFKKSN